MVCDRDQVVVGLLNKSIEVILHPFLICPIYLFVHSSKMVRMLTYPPKPAGV